MTAAEEALHEAARAELARIYGKTQRQVDVEDMELQRMETRAQAEREQGQQDRAQRTLRIVRAEAS